MQVFALIIKTHAILVHKYYQKERKKLFAKKTKKLATKPVIYHSSEFGVCQRRTYTKIYNQEKA